MKTFRITYTKLVESIVEIEAQTAADAWKNIKTEKLEKKDKHLIWKHEGELTYKVDKTEEITRHIASNPN